MSTGKGISVTDPAARRRIGILGGTFDPVHEGHLAVAREAYRRLDLDEVRLMPARRPPHKSGRRLTAFETRLEMVRRALPPGPFSASDIDGREAAPSYTIDTLRRLAVLLPESDLFFIIGSDAFDDLHTWKEFSTIPTLCTLVVANRGPEEAFAVQARAVLGRDFADYVSADGGLWRMSGQREGGVFLLSMAPHPAASHEIRRRLRRGQDPGDLLPPAVAGYIREHGLYR